MQNKRHK